MPRERIQPISYVTMKALRVCAASGALFLSFGFFAGRADEPVVRQFGQPDDISRRPSVRELALDEPPPAPGLQVLALSLFPSVEVPSAEWDVAPLRLNLLVGRHRDVYGLDIGLLGNETTCEFAGVQAAGLFNRIGSSRGAVQCSSILNRSIGDFSGLQVSLLNTVGAEMDGIQVGLVNRASVLSGLQVGFFNVVDSGRGVQIGVVNSAREIDGLQIGLLNVIEDSSVPFFPIVNFAF